MENMNIPLQDRSSLMGENFFNKVLNKKNLSKIPITMIHGKKILLRSSSCKFFKKNIKIVSKMQKKN